MCFRCEDFPCVVCGRDVETCICPECQQCHSHGDPFCYQYHGMVKTAEQIDSLSATEARWQQEAEAMYVATLGADAEHHFA